MSEIPENSPLIAPDGTIDPERCVHALVDTLRDILTNEEILSVLRNQELKGREVFEDPTGNLHALMLTLRGLAMQAVDAATPSPPRLPRRERGKRKRR